jgi:hypothetical protein
MSSADCSLLICEVRTRTTGLEAATSRPAAQTMDGRRQGTKKKRERHEKATAAVDLFVLFDSFVVGPIVDLQCREGLTVSEQK